jgi:hypothetical protein
LLGAGQLDWHMYVVHGLSGHHAVSTAGLAAQGLLQDVFSSLVNHANLLEAGSRVRDIVRGWRLGALRGSFLQTAGVLFGALFIKGLLGDARVCSRMVLRLLRVATTPELLETLLLIRGLLMNSLVLMTHKWSPSVE